MSSTEIYLPQKLNDSYHLTIKHISFMNFFQEGSENNGSCNIKVELPKAISNGAFQKNNNADKCIHLFQSSLHLSQKKVCEQKSGSNCKKKD